MNSKKVYLIVCHFKVWDEIFDVYEDLKDAQEKLEEHAKKYSKDGSCSSMGQGFGIIERELVRSKSDKNSPHPE